VQPGDVLQTSGVDGVYPPGLPVAKVSSVDRKVDTGFAKVVLAPMSSPDGVRHVLVLEPLSAQLPARPDPQPEDTKPAKGSKKGTRK
jgi:rod shape-determining protein MreC